jgi:transposase-like protein
MVEKLAGSEDAKRKLRLVLEVVAGEKAVEEACGELGVGRTAFYELRDRLLLAALCEGEPKRVGRPKLLEPAAVEQSEAARLKAENQRLRVELEVAYVREELRLGMPQLFVDKKKRHGPGQRSQKRKRRRRQRGRGGQATGGESGGEAPGGDGDGVAGGDGEDPSC